MLLAAGGGGFHGRRTVIEYEPVSSENIVDVGRHLPCRCSVRLRSRAVSFSRIDEGTAHQRSRSGPDRDRFVVGLEGVIELAKLEQNHPEAVLRRSAIRTESQRIPA